MSLASKVDETMCAVESHRAYAAGVLGVAVLVSFLAGNAVATQDALQGQRTALVSDCKHRIIETKVDTKRAVEHSFWQWFQRP